MLYSTDEFKEIVESAIEYPYDGFVSCCVNAVEGYTANIEVVRRTPSGKTTFQEQILFEFDGESPRVKHCQTISPFRSFNGNGRAMQIFDQIERLIRIKVGLPPRNMTRYCIL